MSGETYEKLRRAQNLLRHTIPNGDPAAIFDRALTLLVAELEKTKLAATARPRAQRPFGVRLAHVAAAIKRVVWKRDGGQCAFVGGTGRCTERGFLENHHVVPEGARRRDQRGDNLQLRCRAHNAYEAEQHFGSLWVRKREPLIGGPSELCPDWFGVAENVSLRKTGPGAEWVSTLSLPAVRRSSSSGQSPERYLYLVEQIAADIPGAPLALCRTRMRTRAFSRSTTDVTIVSGIPDGVFTAYAVSSVVTASIGVCPANAIRRTMALKDI